MPEIIILIGKPCTGKSTWAKQKDGYSIVCRDSIKKNLNNLLHDEEEGKKENVTLLFTRYCISLSCRKKILFATGVIPTKNKYKRPYSY